MHAPRISRINTDARTQNPEFSKQNLKPRTTERRTLNDGPQTSVTSVTSVTTVATVASVR